MGHSANSGSSTATSVTGLAPSTGTGYHVFGTCNVRTSTASLYVNGARVDWANGVIEDVHFSDRAPITTETSELATG
jgi:hypothetical protein